MSTMAQVQDNVEVVATDEEGYQLWGTYDLKFRKIKFKRVLEIEIRKDGNRKWIS